MNTRKKFISRIAALLNTSAAIAVLVFGFSHPAGAQNGADTQQRHAEAAPANIAERYPPGSIQSVETADKVLADAQQERARAEAKFAEDERACYPKFFVTSCVDAAKEERRKALAQVQQVEVEANAFKRRARAAERDRALAEKAPQAAPIIKPPKDAKTGDSEARKSDPAESARPENAGRSDDSQRARQSPAARDRVAEHNARLEKLQEREAADAVKRAENVAAFERKARKAEERQREVAARKAEKERKRAEKNSQPANP